MARPRVQRRFPAAGNSAGFRSRAAVLDSSAGTSVIILDTVIAVLLVAVRSRVTDWAAKEFAQGAC